MQKVWFPLSADEGDLLLLQDKVLVGSEARRQAHNNPQNTFSSVKRLIGTSFEAASAELQYAPFKAQPGPSGGTLLCCPARLVLHYATLHPKTWLTLSRSCLSFMHSCPPLECPYPHVAMCPTYPVFKCRGAVYTPQEVSSHIVRHLISHAGEALGSSIHDAVISSLMPAPSMLCLSNALAPFCCPESAPLHRCPCMPCCRELSLYLPPCR